MRMTTPLAVTFASIALLFFASPAAAQTPTNLTVKAATSKRVDLSWTGAAGTYIVQRRQLGSSYSDLSTVSATTASDTQIDPFTTYQYQVLASTASGRSTASNEVTVGPPPQGFSVAAPAPGPPGSSLAGSYGYNISMILDGNGDPMFAFVFDDPNQDTNHSDTQLLFRSWNRALYKWNAVVTVATVGDIATFFKSTVSLARDAGTNVLAIASEINNEAGVRLFVSSDGGATWTAKITFQTQGLSSTGPSLTLANGNLYLAYTVTNQGLKYVTGTLSAAASTWQTKTAPQPSGTSTAFTNESPSLALDSNNTPGIAYWVGDDTSSYNMILFFWRPTGGNPVKVMDSQDNQSNAAVKLIYHGLNPRIAVYVQRNDADFGVGMHFTHSDNGGVSWNTPVVIPPDGDSSTDYPFDLAVDSQDHGAIAMGRNSGSGDSVCRNPKLSLSTDLTHWTTCAAASVDITGDYDVYPASIALLYGGNDKLYMAWAQQGDNGTGVGVLLWREPPAGASNAPSISTNGVVSAATFQPGIVAGSWVTILGANFTDVTGTWVNADFSSGHLPTTLGGVQVNINGQPAAVYYVSPTQLNVQAPASINGNVSVQVSHNNIPSNTVTANAVQTAPGLFTYTVGSKTFPAAVFLDSTIVGDPALNGNTRKAKPGDRILLYATGLAPSPAGVVITAPAAVSSTVAVTIGSNPATVEFAGLVAVGEFQINIIVPNVAAGDYPIKLTVNGQSTQSGVTLSVAP